MQIPFENQCFRSSLVDASSRCTFSKVPYFPICTLPFCLTKYRFINFLNRFSVFRNIKSPFVSVRKFDIVKKVTNLESPKAPLYLHENPENFIFRVFYLRGTLTFQEVYKIKSPFVSSRKIGLFMRGRGGRSSFFCRNLGYI